MISDEFETFGDNHFWRGETKTKIFVQKIIQFIKIKNIHSKEIFIFFKIQNIHSKEIFIFSKSRIFIQKNYSFFQNQKNLIKENIHFLKAAESSRATQAADEFRDLGFEALL